MKHTAILFSALACTILASCAQEEPAAPRPHGNQNWAILAKTDFSADDSDLFHGIWQPTEAEVPRLIKEARLHLEKLNKTAPSEDQRVKAGEALAEWDNYLCQVVGHTRNGQKLVHLNFFLKEDLPTDEEGADWQHRYFNGGSDYWRIEYDTKAKAFLDFEPNGDG